ncbi:MAG: glutathione S-transferase N-terminal domain-containing protein [Hyphomicrobiales bacterium]|nr:glutathione S-transferase N-terminal domain-containing protein [Hyphomicrobiales bacterium]
MSKERFPRDLILYSFRRCPYAMRTRLAIYYSKNSCEIREISLKNKPSEFIALSPKATVPVLQIGNELVIEESMEIIKWFLSKNDPFQLMLPYEKENVDEVISLIDKEFKYHLDRYKYSTRYDPSKKYEHRLEAIKKLEYIENKISNTGYIFGNQISIYEVCILPFIRQFRIADIKWFDEEFQCVKLKKILYDFIESQAFKVTMKKYNEWDSKKDNVQYFPTI